VASCVGGCSLKGQPARSEKREARGSDAERRGLDNLQSPISNRTSSLDDRQRSFHLSIGSFQYHPPLFRSDLHFWHRSARPKNHHSVKDQLAPPLYCVREVGSGASSICLEPSALYSAHDVPRRPYCPYAGMAVAIWISVDVRHSQLTTESEMIV
jgi:hypothetical protein